MAVRVLPADSELVSMRDRGMTHQQIADEVSRRTGRRIARSSVSVALSRAGEQKEVRVRYRREVPWTVPTRYTTEYPLRMLRGLGRMRSDLPMGDTDKRQVADWVKELDERGLIVAYCPAPPPSKPAFYYIPAEYRDHKDKATPIRKQPVTATQIGF